MDLEKVKRVIHTIDIIGNKWWRNIERSHVTEHTINNMRPKPKIEAELKCEWCTTLSSGMVFI